MSQFLCRLKTTAPLRRILVELPKFPPDLKEWLPGKPFAESPLPAWMRGNPDGNPDSSSEVEDIVEKAGLGWIPPKFFPLGEVRVRKRPPAATRTRNVGPYTLYMERTDDTCAIRLHEWFGGGRRKTWATWSGYSKAQCARKFEEVVEAIEKARFEHKATLIRRIGW